MNKSRAKTHGFTLLEMSIVLVLFALLVAMINAGEELLEQYKLRAVITEFYTYKNAVTNFQDQFKFLPGDIPNATDYWYNASTCPGTSYIAGSCNGNGDGFIYASFSDPSDESLRAWQHLSLANMIPGQYAGVESSSGSGIYYKGIDVPISKFNAGGWNFETANVDGGGTQDGNILLFTAKFSGPTYSLISPFTVWQALHIDIKADDGLPLTGRMRGAFIDGSCAFGGVGISLACGLLASNLYNIVNINNRFCSMFFWM